MAHSAVRKLAASSVKFEVDAFGVIEVDTFIE